MKKQSSIEWLIEQLEAQGFLYDLDILQAKTMHKEESELLFECGRNFQITGEGIFNQAYNEIFGGQDNE